jgi:hypothetical protein
MESITYAITLSDGTVIANLRLNGNNYVSDTELTEDDFSGKLDGVTIESSDGAKEEHTNMELIQVKQYGSEWWFVLRDISEEELKAASMDAQVLYTAIVTDTLLEEV